MRRLCAAGWAVAWWSFGWWRAAGNGEGLVGDAGGFAGGGDVGGGDAGVCLVSVLAPEEANHGHVDGLPVWGTGAAGGGEHEVECPVAGEAFVVLHGFQGGKVAHDEGAAVEHDAVYVHGLAMRWRGL